MSRKITLALFVILFTIPALAQDSGARRAPTEISPVVRVINFQDANLENVTVVGSGVEYDLPAFIRTVPLPLTPGLVEITADTSTGQTIRTSFTAEPGDFYEAVVFSNNGIPTMRAYGYADLLGTDLDLANSSPWMRVNLFEDVRAIDVLYDGQEVVSELPYGEAAVALAPLEIFTLTVLDSDTGEVLTEFDQGYGEPHYISISIFAGNFYGENWFSRSYDQVYADPITYLRDISRYNIRDNFSIFLDLVERAGMTEEIRTLTDAQLFVPDDEALLALGDAIPRDDPAALRAFIRSYITEDENAVFLADGETNTAVSLAGPDIVVNNVDGDRYVNKAAMYYNYYVMSPFGMMQLAILDGAFPVR